MADEVSSPSSESPISPVSSSSDEVSTTPPAPAKSPVPRINTGWVRTVPRKNSDTPAATTTTTTTLTRTHSNTSPPAHVEPLSQTPPSPRSSSAPTSPRLSPADSPTIVLSPGNISPPSLFLTPPASPIISRSQTVSSSVRHIKVNIPALGGNKTKKIDLSMSVREVIIELNRSLPPHLQSDLFCLYIASGTVKMDPNATLSSYNIGHMDEIELKREPKYIIVAPKQLERGSLDLDKDIKTMPAIKKIGDWLFGSASDHKYQLFRITKGSIIRQEFLELKEFSAYRLCKNDVLEIDLLAGESSETIQLLVDYSPIGTESSKEAEQVLAFERTKKHAEDVVQPRKRSVFSSFLGTAVKDPRRRSPSFSPLAPAEPVLQEFSRPYNVVHRSHVDFNFTWSGQKPETLFEFGSKLGQGAYGGVFKAQHRETGFLLAVKVIPVVHAAKTALESEIETLKKCKHSNIVSYFGTCSKQGEIWILMDYCAVGSVKDLMEMTLETLNEKQVVEVLFDTLKGLDYLHNNNILHLDIKAANIMLTDEGKSKLGDFGVSQELKKGVSMLQASNMIGSPLYMSPEVIKAQTYNYKSDIWSLGITAIEMMEGRPPNNDINSMQKLIWIVERPSPTLRKPHQYTPQLNDFIAKCLSKEPEGRPRTKDLLQHAFILQTATGNAEVLKPLISQFMRMKDEVNQSTAVTGDAGPQNA